MRPASQKLSLSSFVLPQLRIGLAPIGPVNLTHAPERQRYVEGLVAHVNRLLDDVQAGRRGPDEVRAFTREAPFFASLAVLRRSAGAVRCEPQRGARDLVSFDADRVRLLFADGRLRALSQFVFIETGQQTHRFASLMPKLLQGIDGDALARLGERLELDLTEAVPELLRRRVLERGERPPEVVLPRFAASARDRLTWLGHGFVVFQSGGTTVWVDPRMLPRMVFSEREARALFTDDVADGLLVPDYGPGALQLVLRNLPPPDAVCLTHPDADHFDPGLLMCLPESTPILVPKHLSGAPWDVDLPGVLRRLLGRRRRIVALGHGEHHDLGAVRIHVLPFRGRMPAHLPHRWNTYVLQTRRTAVAATSHSVVDDEHVSAIATLARGRRLMLLCAPVPPSVAHKTMYGYRDQPAQVHNVARPWSWFQGTAAMFAPTPAMGLHLDTLAEIAKRVRRPLFFPYAWGSTPWCRVPDPDQVFFDVSDTSFWRHTFDRTERNVAQLRAGVTVPRLQYGVPFAL